MNSKKIIHKVLATNDQWSTLSLRIVLGIIFIAHGAQKLFGWFGGYGLQGTAGFFESQLGMSPGILWAFMAGAGEFFGGILVLVGLFTRLGAANLAFTMLVAIYTVHSGAFFAPEGMEYPLALFAASVSLVISGGGQLSIDRQIAKSQESA